MILGWGGPQLMPDSGHIGRRRTFAGRKWPGHFLDFKLKSVDPLGRGHQLRYLCFTPCELQVGINHNLDELLEAYPWFPA